MSKNVVILGASNKPDRYAYKALRMLREYGYDVVPVNPVLDEIEGVEVKHSLDEVENNPDTLTVYVRPERLETVADKIIRVHPRRVILNPGTESDTLEKRFRDEGIEVLRACTLVLLRTRQF